MKPLLFCLFVDRYLFGMDEMNIDFKMSFILLFLLPFFQELNSNNDDCSPSAVFIDNQDSSVKRTPL